MNKRISKQLGLALILLAGLGLGSCKKYLDQEPITSVTPEFVFSDVTNTRSALIGVYQQLTGDNGYGLKWSIYFPVGNDAEQGPTGAADGGRRDFPLYATTATNTQMFAAWNQAFKGIQLANLCIANIPKVPQYTSGTDQEKKQLNRMLGEALTLRAQFYFEAIRNWGDLPSHFSPAEDSAAVNPFPNRVDRDILYDRILNDLKQAEGIVPWKNEVASIGDLVDERITKGAVKGLRARIALFRGGWSLRQDGSFKRGQNYQSYYQIARDETNDIIKSGQHGLDPSFKDLWKNQVGARVVNDPYGELMFQVTAIGRSASADTKIGYNSGPPVFDTLTQTSGATGTSSVYILPTYFYYFDSTDTRRDVTCAPYMDTAYRDGVTFVKRGQTITSIFDGKYRRDWLNPTLGPGNYLNNYSGFKWQVLRYSDVLLMFAEAENELNGPTGDAFNAINLVRRRAFGSTSADLTGIGKDELFAAIVRERYLEFGGEGIRKFDLIRWNMLDKAINESKANITKMGAAQIMVPPTYMAPPPSYVLNTANLPTKMYFINKSTSDNMNLGGGLVANSLYKTAPSSTPANTYSVNWVTNAISTGTGSAVTLNHFANSYTKGKSELLPIPQDAITAYGSFAGNLPQNPNY